MLLLIRWNVSAKKVLLGCGMFIGAMTLFFGLISPAFNFLSLQVGFSSILFTIVTGTLITAALIVLAKFASVRTAQFAVAFLAIQCLLNSLSDLKTLFFINAPGFGSDIQTDAGNMAAATGLPGIVWVVIWIGLSLVMISIGLRLYAVNKAKATGESLFEN
ncbi:MAG: M50 family metallopeptidase, partial [Pyrinomonadaceae bacterium]